MIQAFGLTSNARKEHPLAVDDVSFEARAGRVTALLGAPGAGKTAALRLMLELQQGRGITYFRGRPLHRIAHPSREVGVLLGDVPGHPARSVRGHLRMLCAAAGVPARRADEVLEVVGLVSLRDERLGNLARGMDRRLGLACALLSDPHTLVLDEPADALSARESRWLYGMLRAHAAQGGTVLFTTAEPKEAARCADRVVTLEQGRLVADQEAEDFARTRLRPRVAVRSPHANRLAALLTKEARTAHRSVEVVREDGNRLSVYGSTCADVGETAFRHDILVHQLADEIGDMGPGAGTTPCGEPETVDEPRVSYTPPTAEMPATLADMPSAELPSSLTAAALAETPSRLTDAPVSELPTPSTDPLPAGAQQPRAAASLAKIPQPHTTAPLAEAPQPLTAARPTAQEPELTAEPRAPYEAHTASADRLPDTTASPNPRPTTSGGATAQDSRALAAGTPATPGPARSRLVPLIDPEETTGTHTPARAPRSSQALTLDTLPPLPPPSPSARRPARCARSATSCVGQPVSVPGFLPGPLCSSCRLSPRCCWPASVTLRSRVCWPRGRGSCPCRPRRWVRDCSGRSRSVTSSATLPWRRTAAPCPAGWGCSSRSSSSPRPPR